MEFEAIILEHRGKDIYIEIEIPKEHKKQETVFHNYQVVSLDGNDYDGSGVGLLSSKENHKEFLRLEMKAKVEKNSRLFDMIDLEARYQEYFYHIYIMNYIDIENSYRFVIGQER